MTAVVGMFQSVFQCEPLPPLSMYCHFIKGSILLYFQDFLAY